jgi:hypothetical protein
MTRAPKKPTHVVPVHCGRPNHARRRDAAFRIADIHARLCISGQSRGAFWWYCSVLTIALIDRLLGVWLRYSLKKLQQSPTQPPPLGHTDLLSDDYSRTEFELQPSKEAKQELQPML